MGCGQSTNLNRSYGTKRLNSPPNKASGQASNNTQVQEKHGDRNISQIAPVQEKQEDKDVAYSEKRTESNHANKENLQRENSAKSLTESNHSNMKSNNIEDIKSESPKQNVNDTDAIEKLPNDSHVEETILISNTVQKNDSNDKEQIINHSPEGDSITQQTEQSDEQNTTVNEQNECPIESEPNNPESVLVASKDLQEDDQMVDKGFEEDFNNSALNTTDDQSRISDSVIEDSEKSQDLNPSLHDAENLQERIEPIEISDPADNVLTDRDDLPELPAQLRPADCSVLYGHSQGKWPIRNFAKTGFNVNAQHGGCAMLMVCSCSYGGKGEETTAELIFFRSGFDCNHYANSSIQKSNKGHFGCQNYFAVEEDGHLLGNLMFGTNDIMLITNDSQYGNLGSVGIYLEGPDAAEESQSLNIGVNASGNALVLCSGTEASVGDATLINAAYMVRTGHKDSHIQASHFFGEDKWKFDVGNDGTLIVTGCKRSHYAVFHNRPKQVAETNVGKPYVLQTQATDGRQKTVILSTVPDYGELLLLCSNSNGTENATAAVMYMVTIETNDEIKLKKISGLKGDGYETEDLWKVEKDGVKVVVIGPSGPCKYAVISNIRAAGSPKFSQDLCLATGEPRPVLGAVDISGEMVKGVVDKPSKISIKVDHKVIATFQAEHLKKLKNGWGFCRKWKEGEVSVGSHMVQVHMVRSHVTSGDEQYIHMVGSPKQVVIQKKGVVYALNCGGPAYTFLNDITYSSEHGQFASFTYDYNSGSQYKMFGKGFKTANIPQLLCKTHDGFLYSTGRTPAIEPLDEQKIKYKIKDLPNGDFTFRVHLLQKVTNSNTLMVNGQQLIGKVAEVAKTVRDVIPEHKGYTAYYADVPLKISDNMLFIDLPRNPELSLCGFAVLDKSYSEKRQSEEEIKKDEAEKYVLMDKTEPLQRSMKRKELTIVGWSQNLLKNASGENGDLSHWNTSGDWKLMEGGYQTEKAFVTSHMACNKYQEVNLLDYFSAEYLDTAPDIQVSEWHREGVCGGGHYGMEATLMDEGGEVIKDFNTGMSGRIYRNNEWAYTEHMFTNYGKGARIVSISSTGKDDKYWGGHYGPLISTSTVRVKRESVPASDDSFMDINMDHASDGSTWAVKGESLVSKVLADNRELLKELLEEEAVPTLDKEFEKQTEISAGANKKRRQHVRKKREIRVFVSSTFKDFRKEREEIIKKAFREINRVCADRGVFFTYVDLRWGITSEQTESGKTIAICLQEIERCRPYFLCMMGTRFGWCQREESKDDTLNDSYNYAIENHPSLKWIDEYRYDVSVTQLEILHGVLNNVEKARDRSFFYLREPVKQEDVDEDEFKKLTSESDWHAEKQMSLRNRVQQTPDLNLRSFITPEEVRDQMKEDLQWCVDQDFPLGTELTPLEREREAHQAFADARCRVYIGRQEYFTDIDDNLEKDLNQPFVLLGESGSGKSALVANWSKRVRDKHPDWFIFIHFIGSSAESASYIKLLRRLYEEIKEFFGFGLSIPSSDATLITDLSKWLHLASTQSKCVIVLDALNQLDDGQGNEDEHDLLWIPKDVPHNMFLLLSTLPGRAMNAVSNFGWPTMGVKPLDPSQKMEIITGYLEGLYGKTLSQEQKDMIVDVPQTDNPLYLKSLLDEVRVYGSFSRLTGKIQEYLSAANPGDLFAKILDRLEGDFEGEESRVALVRETTTAIWCSQRGMAESELIDLLEIPSAIWSPFYLSIAENLVNRNGILNFFHDHLRQAVQTKYLSTPEAKKQGYLKLADFFEKRDLDDRVVDELPSLLAKGGDLERLRKVISKLDVFKIMVKSEDGLFDLIKSWKLLGDFTQVEETYIAELSKIPESQRHSESYSQLLDNLGSFFVQIGLYGAARKMYEKLIQDLESRYAVSHGTVVYNPYGQDWKYRSQHPDVINALHKLGLVCEKEMELEAGAQYYKDAISRQNRITTPSQKLQLCEGLLGLSSILYLQENMKEAKKLMVRCLELATDVLGKRHHYVAAILNKLGQFVYTQGRLDEALGYHLQDLKLTRSEVGLTHPRIAGIFNDIALVYDDKNEALAGELYESSLVILLDMYGSSHVDIASLRYNLGAFYFGNNYFSKAKYQFQESYKIFQSFLGEDHPDTKAAKSALNEITPMAKV